MVNEVDRINGKWSNPLQKLTFIPRISLSPFIEAVGFHLTHRQFPVCLAFTMTINKSQGQSVKNVGINFQTPVFTHGQFYVAMS